MPNTIKIGINGFGRIGRKIARLALDMPGVEIVGINDLTPTETLAHLFKYDSVHGTLREDVRIEGSTLVVGKHRIACTAEKDPAKLPWGKVGAAFVHECTGIFRTKEKGGLHLQ